MTKKINLKLTRKLSPCLMAYRVPVGVLQGAQRENTSVLFLILNPACYNTGLLE